MAALLHWDRSTIIPKKAVPQRAEQLSCLSALIHERLTSPKLKKLVRVLNSNQNKLSRLDRCTVKEYLKSLKKIEKIPLSHVKAFSKLEIEAAYAWERAREKNDFSLFAPYLEKVLKMKLKEAKLINSQEHPYNVLLDDFEEGMTLQKLDLLFSQLKSGLMEILDRIKESPRYKNQKDLLSPLAFPLEAQKEASKDLKNRILQNPDRHTAAESIHPFTARISADDVRITTAYREGQPLFSFTSTAHEAGHALYELGFASKLQGTILGDAPSFGLHESQSRFWENQIIKSWEFWQFYYPHYKKAFPCLLDLSLEEFYLQINLVRPSLVRIECDEVTYCLHIIIRYELEKAMLEGKLKVKDLPSAWNQKYREYLGIIPKKAVEGVLQDMHWSEGLFGYFPTYVLGTIYSGMILKQLQKEQPRIMNEVAKGNLTAIATWLRQKIHRFGAIYLAEEVIKKICQKNPTPDDFLDYLRAKYYPLYKINEV